MKFKPHKAEDAVIDRLQFPAIVQPKIDGVRGCFITNNFTSRTLKPFRNTNLSDMLTRPELQGFDGELSMGAPNAKGLCRTTTSYVNTFSHKTCKEIPTWYVFDWVNEATHKLPYWKRLAMLEQHIANLKQLDMESFYFLETLPLQKQVTSMEEVLKLHDSYTQLGYEGTVIRLSSAPHKSGRSTVNQSYFMRLKDAGTEECTILDLVEAQVNTNFAETNELGQTERSSHKENKYGKGMVGSLIVQIPDGRVITIGAGKLTHEERITIWENPNNTIGRICTYKYMKHGEHKMRRHPRFVEFRDEDL